MISAKFKSGYGAYEVGPAARRTTGAARFTEKAQPQSAPNNARSAPLRSAPAASAIPSLPHLGRRTSRRGTAAYFTTRFAPHARTCHGARSASRHTASRARLADVTRQACPWCHPRGARRVACRYRRRSSLLRAVESHSPDRGGAEHTEPRAGHASAVDPASEASQSTIREKGALFRRPFSRSTAENATRGATRPRVRAEQLSAPRRHERATPAALVLRSVQLRRVVRRLGSRMGVRAARSTRAPRSDADRRPRRRAGGVVSPSSWLAPARTLAPVRRLGRALKAAQRRRRPRRPRSSDQT